MTRHRLDAAVARFRREGETSVDTSVRLAQEASLLADLLRSVSGSPSVDAARMIVEMSRDAMVALRAATRVAARLPEPPESDVLLG